MDRRDFLKVSGASLLGFSMSGLLSGCEKMPDKTEDYVGEKPTGHFSMVQLTSSTDTIGNSYVLKTTGGKLIVMDGGMNTDALKLKEYIKSHGNVVDAWFLSHPHSDHVGAISQILEDGNGPEIKTIYHSKFPDEHLRRESGGYALASKLYAQLDSLENTGIVDLQTTGAEYDIDGVFIKVLGVTNPEITSNPYNNSSMILRVWDDSKSVLFLGDAGEECGDKVINKYYKYLNCDYVQMAHHGQQGCKKSFYMAIDFRACFWPTPSWLWNADEQSNYRTWETRQWMDEKGIREHHVSCLEMDYILY